jgi:hypothetical protein
MAKKELSTAFREHLMKKYPEMDCDLIASIFYGEVDKVKPGIFINNPELRLPIDSDIVISIMINTFQKYSEAKEGIQID